MLGGPRRRNANAFVRRNVLGIGALLVAAGLSLSAGGQQSGQPTFRTGADYVRVDVYPTVNGLGVDDLSRDDFQVLEDGVPQQIDAFEFVRPAPRSAGFSRPEPTTVAESRAALTQGRARVFVLYLDTWNVTSDASLKVAKPLADSLEQLIGPDDLIAVFTPQMSPGDITFTRRPASIEQFLRQYARWGQREFAGVDAMEQRYQACYPGYGPSAAAGGCKDDDRGIADEMIARRREQSTLDSLTSMVQVLGTAREERKAVLVISEGWILYRPDSTLTRRVNCTVPQPTISIDTRSGRLASSTDAGGDLAKGPSCEGDRMALAEIDDRSHLQQLMQLANRANVSFYTIDPRGLATFDTPIDQQRTGLVPAGQHILPTPTQDSAALSARQSALRDLAANTDGIALLNTNAMDSAFRRIEADLSSYYLLAYHSTGRLDGKFHRIQVRIVRPGVQVRARPGFLAVSPPAAARVTAASRPAGAVVAATAMKELSSIPRTATVRVRAALTAGALWIDGELPARPNAGAADVELQIVDDKGEMVGSGRVTLPTGARTFRQVVPVKASDGTLTLRVRVASENGQTDQESVDLDLVALAQTALAGRRSAATANTVVPAADLRFRRTEQLRVELPAGDTSITAQLLDRTGRELPVPLTVEARTDADGRQWSSAVLALAPLAQGDYVVQVLRHGAVSEGLPVALAFRVVP